MDINGSPINPWALPVPESRNGGAFAGAGRRNEAVEQPVPPPSSPDTQQNPVPPRADNGGPDFQQMVQRSRFDQARFEEGSAIRMESASFSNQRAVDAYEEQVQEGRRFIGGVELMPRIDEYV